LARAIILATSVAYRKLDLPHALDLEGKNIYYEVIVKKNNSKTRNEFN